jgi:hydroxymethylglutaryl-CoA reductase
MITSRLPGFYKLPVTERRRLAADALGISVAELDQALLGGGLDLSMADKTIENVIGTYALPLALTLNMKMNGRDYLAPMAVEEPSVVAAASAAARSVRDGGGFFAVADAPIMIAQIEIEGVPSVHEAVRAVMMDERRLRGVCDAAVPGLVARGGGARHLDIRLLDGSEGNAWMVVHVHVDCRDAMGANLCNTVAEALAPELVKLTQGRVGLRILSNLCDTRRVRAMCRVPAASLAMDGRSGEEVRDGIVRASRFAERDPYRAATHNKGIMNGIDPVVIATGNDWRAVEAGAHAWAARTGHYGPLATWTVVTPETRDLSGVLAPPAQAGWLQGKIELPLSLGIVGGTSRNHGVARAAIALTGVASAQELAMLAASVGLASNLAALRALATVGIQEGHMALHARSVASAAGARDVEVERVAAMIHAAGTVSLEAAQRALSELRTGSQTDAAE